MTAHFSSCPFCGSSDIDPEYSLAALRDGRTVHEPGCSECGGTAPANVWNKRIGVTNPEWIVNDNGELGVRIGERFFFLYKGDNIEYKEARHDDGTPMLYRVVGKREFGETCQPLPMFRSRWPGRYKEPVVYHPGLSCGTPEDAEWRPLPPSDGPDAV